MRERSIEEVAEDVDQLRTHVDARMTELSAQVQRVADRFDTAPFVRTDVHSVEIGAVRGDVSRVHRMLTWILGILGSALVAGIVAVIGVISRGIG